MTAMTNSPDIPFSHYCIALGILGGTALTDGDDDISAVSPLLPSLEELWQMNEDLHAAGLFKEGRPTFENVDEALVRLRQYLDVKKAVAASPLPSCDPATNRTAGLITLFLAEKQIHAQIVAAFIGPSVTRFELELTRCYDVGRFKKLAEAIAERLGIRPIRLLLPMPGSERVGIEVPNAVRTAITAEELFANPAWYGRQGHIPVMLGKAIGGDIRIIDLAKAPHLLIAGSMGSGKSSCVNLILQSLIRHFRPDELQLILFDPKHVEFNPYKTLPHLRPPVINDPEKAVSMLRRLIDEMDLRYRLLAAAQVKDIAAYNSRSIPPKPVRLENGAPLPERLRYIVIVLDEIADLMARAPKEIGNALAILAAKSRAAGIHLVIATQRPDCMVITDAIKSNFPWRIALKVADAVASRLLLDQEGAEALLGNGDMLFKGPSCDIERIQGGFVSTESINAVVHVCASQERAEQTPPPPRGSNDGETDALVARALAALRRGRRASVCRLQSELGIGYHHAAALLDELEERGYVGPQPQSGLRDIYWSKFPLMDGDDTENQGE